MSGGRLSRRGAAPPVRLVHLGLGNFYRAHQAWYTSRAGEWGYAAFTGRGAQPAGRRAQCPGRLLHAGLAGRRRGPLRAGRQPGADARGDRPRGMVRLLRRCRGGRGDRHGDRGRLPPRRRRRARRRPARGAGRHRGAARGRAAADRARAPARRPRRPLPGGRRPAGRRVVRQRGGQRRDGAAGGPGSGRARRTPRCSAGWTGPSRSRRRWSTGSRPAPRRRMCGRWARPPAATTAARS